METTLDSRKAFTQHVNLLLHCELHCVALIEIGLWLLVSVRTSFQLVSASSSNLFSVWHATPVHHRKLLASQRHMPVKFTASGSFASLKSWSPLLLESFHHLLPISHHDSRYIEEAIVYGLLKPQRLRKIDDENGSDPNFDQGPKRLLHFFNPGIARSVEYWLSHSPTRWLPLKNQDDQLRTLPRTILWRISDPS